MFVFSFVSLNERDLLVKTFNRLPIVFIHFVPSNLWTAQSSAIMFSSFSLPPHVSGRM